MNLIRSFLVFGKKTLWIDPVSQSTDQIHLFLGFKGSFQSSWSCLKQLHFYQFRTLFSEGGEVM